MDPESLDLPRLDLKRIPTNPLGLSYKMKCGYFEADESRQEEIRRQRGGEGIQA